MPYIRIQPANKEHLTEGEVAMLWNKDKDFIAPDEPYAYICKRSFLAFGNKLDGIMYDFQGITVTLERAIL